MFVKPGTAPDGRPLLVRDPDTKRALPAEGAEVPRNQFWLRRLRDRDVVPTTTAPPVAAATASAPHGADHES